MTRSTSCLCVALLCLPITALGETFANGTKCELSKNLMLKAKAKGKGKKHRVPRGAILEIVNLTKGWSEVTHEGETRFAKTKQLKRFCKAQQPEAIESVETTPPTEDSPADESAPAPDEVEPVADSALTAEAAATAADVPSGDEEAAAESPTMDAAVDSPPADEAAPPVEETAATDEAETMAPPVADAPPAAVSESASPPSSSGGGLRLGANVGFLYFSPGPSYGMNVSVRAGWMFNDWLGAYVDASKGFGIGGGGDISDESVNVSISAAGYTRYAVMGEARLGPLFAAAGPTLADAAWMGVEQVAGTNGAAQNVYVVGGYTPGLLARGGLILGQFTLAMEFMVLAGKITEVNQSANASGAGQSVKTGDMALGLSPVLMIGWDM